MRQILSRFSIPLLFACFVLAMSIAGGSCKKEQLLQSGGDLRFSTDTLTFDTVFTTLGSATIAVKIFNPQGQKIVVSSVRLAGGDASVFHLNVDGKPGAANNVEIAANDSVYVFATVRVNPDDANLPFIVEDRLIATLNGNDFSIPIIAYGQNAHYIRDSVIHTSEPWLTDKPYVVLGYAIVDSASTLTIPAGCRIYMHANARLFVAGTLHAVGTKKDSIIFQGDRLDRSYYGYEGYPGEWGGLYFTEHSTDNILEHVIIRNCGNGAQGAAPAAIQVAPDAYGGTTPAPQLTLHKTIIENSIGYGLLSFGGTVKAENCLIHSCGASALALLQGGHYELNNCTFATYGNTKISHTDNPVAAILNYYYISQTKYIAGPLAATMRNCVVAGSLEHEFIADSVSDAPATLTMEHCLLKVTAAKIPAWVSKTNIRYTLPDGTFDPQFTDVAKANYRPRKGSPLIDAGESYNNITPTDLDEAPRTVPDIGCYEGQ